jgi:predicted nucleic acid-binding protein
MKKYTVNASVLVKLVVEEEHSGNALRLISSNLAATLYAPDIIFYEIASVLYKMARRGIMKPNYALQAYENLLKLPLETVDCKQIPLRNILDMSLRLGVHYYDCLYIHVAKTTSSVLVSSDEQLLAAAGKECKATSLAEIRE